MLQRLRHVVIPVLAPGLLTVAVFSLRETWNEFPFVLSVTTSSDYRTLLSTRLNPGDHVDDDAAADDLATLRRKVAALDWQTLDSSVLDHFGAGLADLLKRHEADYHVGLKRHFDRHLQAFSEVNHV